MTERPSPAQGRDGISGFLTPGRATRAREVSRPSPEDLARAETALGSLLDRIQGRRASRD